LRVEELRILKNIEVVVAYRKLFGKTEESEEEFKSI
jgi:hypothetical protein